MQIAAERIPFDLDIVSRGGRVVGGGAVHAVNARDTLGIADFRFADDARDLSVRLVDGTQ